jgi:predicted nucleotidyltransferase
MSIEHVYDQIRGFAKARGAKRVILFGSRARGDEFPRSDIDLAVCGCSDFDGFVEDLQERLRSLLQVDVVNLDEPVSKALLDDIRRDGKVLYEAV